MIVLLSLFAALAYGASDFVAGASSRRADSFAVALTTQTGGVIVSVLALLLAPLLGLSGPADLPAVLWGAVSGIGAAAGTLGLYRGLGRGRMSVVAPVSGLLAAVLPAVLAVATGEHLSLLAGAGVLVGMVAVGMVSAVPAADVDAGRPSGLVDGLVAGVGFAVLFVALDRAGGAAGLWPNVASSAASLVVIGAVLAVLRRPARLPGRTVLPLLGAGGLASVALVAFLVATSRGGLAIAAVLTSLYPGGTVLLAVLVLRERMSRLQQAGLVLAAVAVVAVTLG